jgi:hypothetical protein
MPGLSTYETPKAFIPFGLDPNKGMTVRALNLDDLTEMISAHLGPIAEAVELYEKNRADMFAAGNIDRFVITVMRVLPQLSAEIIAVAADEPELTEAAGRLAFGIQLRALSEVARMTLEDAGGLKNLFAALASALPGLNLPRGTGATPTTEETATNGVH